MELYGLLPFVFCVSRDRDHYSGLSRCARFRPFSETLIKRQTENGQRRLAMDVNNNERIMDTLIAMLNDLMWGAVLIYLLIGVGIFFTFRLGFIQIRHFGHMFSVLKNSRKSDNAGISSFQALCTSLAARVGTGNLAGVAVAIYLGGPGAIFWMWLIAFIGMATAFVESTLAQLYKVKDEDGNYRGGPAYYMEKGLGMRWMGVVFSLCLILAFGLVFNAVQANSISLAMKVAFGIPDWVSGLALVALSGLIIFGGIRGIARFAELVVPFMALAYILLALVIVAMNITELPHVFMLIIKSAFGIEQAGSGALGYAISQAMINGIKRGLFSNEAGMGSAPNAAATATPYPPHPASQGYVQMLGVFMDTIVICSCTAAIILMSGQFEPGSGVTGVELTQRALSSQIGSGGNIFIAAAIFFFAFTSIVAKLLLCRDQSGVPRAQPQGWPDAVPGVRTGDGDVRRRG